MSGYNGLGLVGYRTVGQGSVCPEGSFPSPGEGADPLLRELGFVQDAGGCWYLPASRPMAPVVQPPRTTTADESTDSMAAIATQQQLPASSSTEREFLRIINDYRHQYGLQPLIMNRHLIRAARWHSEHMKRTGIVSHVIRGEPHGDSVYERAPAAGYTGNGIGENIAYKSNGYTPMEVFMAWKNSPQHNQQMLDRDWNVIGVGDGGTMWTTVFGNKPDGSEETDISSSPAIRAPELAQVEERVRYRQIPRAVPGRGYGRVRVNWQES